MTNEEIIEIASKHLEEGWIDRADGTGYLEFSGTPKEIISFAQEIIEISNKKTSDIYNEIIKSGII